MIYILYTYGDLKGNFYSHHIYVIYIARYISYMSVYYEYTINVCVYLEIYNINKKFPYHFLNLNF